jgi:hypothetical protein
VIPLHISFGTLKNPHIEYIIFDVVDMPYPYNTIFGRGLLNTFEAAQHSGYLCLKIPATSGVITIFGSNKEERNIERGFALEHKNMQFLREDLDLAEQSSPRQEPSPEFNKAIEAKGDFTRLALDLEYQAELCALESR